MADNDTVTLHELVVANTIELDALIRVLLDKGMITEPELLDAVREMKRRMVGKDRPGSA